MSKDRISHMDMIESIRLQNSDILLANDHGVLLFERQANLHMLSVDSRENMNDFIPETLSPKLLAVHQKFLVDKISETFQLNEFMQCKQAVWTSSNLIRNKEDIEVQPLSIDYLEKVHSIYSHDIGIDYLRERIQTNNLFGYFVKGQLAAFIGMHAEGSMGMLEVKSEYRNQEIGSKLLLWLINHLIEQKRTPFSQITLDNEASCSLHARLGFEFSEGLIYWMEK